MKTQARTLALVAALAAASALTANAASENGYFDGGPVQPRASKPLTQHQAAEARWLEAQIAVGSASVEPIPFPLPEVRVSAGRPAQLTLHTVEENEWLELERERGPGSTPVPFPPQDPPKS
jgi:hypothetical protein